MPRILLGFAAGFLHWLVPCRAEQTSANPEMLIRLNVRPRPAPKPALRYRLLPELREMSPGNPIQSYMKCSMEQRDSSSTKRRSIAARSCWRCR